MLKQKDVVIIGIPKYEELSIKNIWPLLKDNDDLLEYFLNYSDKQVPDSDFKFSLLWSFWFNVIQKMVDDAGKKNRALESNENENQFVYIQNDIFNEISNVLAQKSINSILY